MQYILICVAHCFCYRNDLLVIASLIVSLCPTSPFMVGEISFHRLPVTPHDTVGNKFVFLECEKSLVVALSFFLVFFSIVLQETGFTKLIVLLATFTEGNKLVQFLCSL